jgi:TonB family protein
MFNQNDKDEYFRIIFKKSLIISFSILIILFYSLQKFKRISINRMSPIQTEIFISDIPITHQSFKNKRIAPKKPSGFIPIPSEEDELPDELIEEMQKNTPGSKIMSTGYPVEDSPKIILEVYPQNKGFKCRGIIRLLVLISENGVVKDIEVVENSTGSNECLQLAIDAVSNSKWLPGKVKNKPVDIWIMKTYKFNIQR